MRPARSELGGTKVASSTLTDRTRSIRKARTGSLPGLAATTWHRRYHRPWRTTIAHGSTSTTHSEPASER